MRHGLLIAAVLLAVPAAGCTEDLSYGAGGASDPTITKYAALNVTNADPVEARFSASTTLGGEQVDVTHYTFPANGSHELSLGLPSRGNVEVLLQHQDTQKELRFTLEAASCKNPVINIELADGQPNSKGITCS